MYTFFYIVVDIRLTGSMSGNNAQFNNAQNMKRTPKLKLQA